MINFVITVPKIEVGPLVNINNFIIYTFFQPPDILICTDMSFIDL